MKALHNYILLLMMALVLSACDVHEFPDEPDDPSVENTYKLHLRFDNSVFDYLTTVNPGTRGERPHGDCDFRVVVRLYPVEPASGLRPSRISTRDGFEIYSGTFPDDGSHPDVEIPLYVAPGEYQIAAWADHVAKGSEADLYYNSSEFLEVTLPGVGEKGYQHKGNDPYREAWRGSETIIVHEDGSVSLSTRAEEVCHVVYMDMQRPLARYHFVTNDYRKFVETETRRLAALGLEEPKAPKLEDYRVVVRYTGYMPCAFNVLTDKPIDSATGITYDGVITPIDADKAEVAFDYVFVNHSATSVQVALELYRKADGMRLSSTGVINVPLQRGHYTLIEGPFMTTDAGASTGIVPDFEGEFNIEIN